MNTLEAPSITSFTPNFYTRSISKSNNEYKGKYSVPVLWDKKTSQIVNNESVDIMRMLDTAFNDHLPKADLRRKLNFYPPELKHQIDEINSWMSPDLNEGVYKAAFAPTQEASDSAAVVVFETLDRLEKMLKEQNSIFIIPGTPYPTEVDIKLYTTLVRFDTIYQQHFKLMLKSIRHNYQSLNRWLKNYYWNVPGVKETTNFKHIKENYSKSHLDINPKSITPLGPDSEVEPWNEEDERWKREVVGDRS